MWNRPSDHVVWSLVMSHSQLPIFAMCSASASLSRLWRSSSSACFRVLMSCTCPIARVSPTTSPSASARLRITQIGDPSLPRNCHSPLLGSDSPLNSRAVRSRSCVWHSGLTRSANVRPRSSCSEYASILQSAGLTWSSRPALSIIPMPTGECVNASLNLVSAAACVCSATCRALTDMSSSDL